MIDEKQISIITKINTKITSTVYCDQKRIEQVLINLVKNSIDFVPEREGKIILLAKLVKKEKEKETKLKNAVEMNDQNLAKIKYASFIEFTVKDNGPGIPKDKINNLFKKFYQIDTTTTRKNSGTGLGLVICKGIVEAHGGRIWIDTNNTFVSGACFKFIIPSELK
jgi:signal transduction histidine kinase